MEVEESLPYFSEVSAVAAAISVLSAELRLTDQQGWFSDTSIAPGTVVVSIPERSLWVRAELRAEDGSMIALTNPIYIQHPLTTQSLLPE